MFACICIKEMLKECSKSGIGKFVYVKGQIVDIFSFAGHGVILNYSTLLSKKATLHNTETKEQGCVQ